MTYQETLTLLISLVAAAIAFVALYRTRRVAERQLKLQEIQAELAKFQHEILKREHDEKHRADVRLLFTNSGHSLLVENVGHGDARNITVTTDVIGDKSPLIDSEVRGLFPLSRLRPGERVIMTVAVTLGTELPFPVAVHWEDESGDRRTEAFKLSIFR